MKTVLNDIRIERSVLGSIQIQIQLRKEGGEETTTWQMPFKVGQSVEKIVRDLHEFAEIIRKDNPTDESGIDAMKRLLKRDCMPRDQDTP